MRRSKSAGGVLVAVLFAVAVSDSQRGLAEDDQQTARKAQQTRTFREPARLDAETLTELIYAVLRHRGSINQPDFPYVIRVKRVQGRKLQFVEFMRRDGSAQGCDLIATALEMELRVRVPERQLLVRVRHCRIRSPGVLGWAEDHVWELELPEDLRPFARQLVQRPLQETLPLSAEDKKFLAEGYAHLDADRKLAQAFGRECDELLREEKHTLPSRGLVLAADKFVKKLDDRGRFVLTSCSIARFGKAKEEGNPRVIQRLRLGTISLSLPDYYRLIEDTNDPDPITIECADGKRLSIPRR